MKFTPSHQSEDVERQKEQENEWRTREKKNVSRFENVLSFNLFSVSKHSHAHRLNVN